MDNDNDKIVQETFSEDECNKMARDIEDLVLRIRPIKQGEKDSCFFYFGCRNRDHFFQDENNILNRNKLDNH